MGNRLKRLKKSIILQLRLPNFNRNCLNFSFENTNRNCNRINCKKWLYLFSQYKNYIFPD
jgi:hypothetical protein